MLDFLNLSTVINFTFSVILSLLVLYFFRRQLSNLNQKINTIYSLVTTLTNELNRINSLMVMQDENQQREALKDLLQQGIEEDEDEEEEEVELEFIDNELEENENVEETKNVKQIDLSTSFFSPPDEEITVSSDEITLSTKDDDESILSGSVEGSGLLNYKKVPVKELRLMAKEKGLVENPNKMSKKEIIEVLNK
jgi:hypothetical protein